MNLLLHRAEQLSMHQLLGLLLSFSSQCEETFRSVAPAYGIRLEQFGASPGGVVHIDKDVIARRIAEGDCPASLRVLHDHCRQLDDDHRVQEGAAYAVLLWCAQADISRVIVSPPVVPIVSTYAAHDLNGLTVQFTDDAHALKAGYPCALLFALYQVWKKDNALHYMTQAYPLLHVVETQHVADEEGRKLCSASLALPVQADFFSASEQMARAQGEKSGTGGNNAFHCSVGSGISHEVEHVDPEMVILQTNVDDLNPEILAHVLEQLMIRGANDVYTQPVQMKKGRTGFILNVLCSRSKVQQLERVVFQETGTLGIRRIPTLVHRLGRHRQRIRTPWGEVYIKKAVCEGQIIHSTPEYEDCLKIAKEKGIPLKDVYRWVEAEIAQRERE